MPFPLCPDVSDIAAPHLAKAFLNVDPFRCVLCGARMVYTAAISGLTVQGLVLNAQAIAQMRYVKH
ncbi:transposase [Pseudomonas syringae pv. broussonetiae]|nr:transposase [Pseudomonas syringae pv. broussonetiae]